MAFYRGFKSDATRRADKFRAELGLAGIDRFEPFAAAELLRISVCCLDDYTPKVLSAEQLRVLRVGGRAFSAVTVFRGEERRIIYNDAHSPERTASNIAHEISHALLDHPPHYAFDATGCRFIDRDLEEEAAFLAGALLVTEETALWVASSGIDVPAAAQRYGVSADMLTYRLNITGARRRVAARRRSA
jgi:Zn-dependent peptidase ImmA (M78 family)